MEQKSEPPFSHSLPAQLPPTTWDVCEEAAELVTSQSQGNCTQYDTDALEPLDAFDAWEPAELVDPFEACDPVEYVLAADDWLPPIHKMHGRLEVVRQDLPLAAQKSAPPLLHSVPSQSPPTTVVDEFCELFE